jgi:hypothetical protein
MPKIKFRRSMIADSRNYGLSRYLHRQYLQEEHIKNAAFIDIPTTNYKKPYIKIFGKYLPISESEAKSTTLPIYR